MVNRIGAHIENQYVFIDFYSYLLTIVTPFLEQTFPYIIAQTSSPFHVERNKRFN